MSGRRASSRIWPWPGDVTEQLRHCRWSCHPWDCPAAQHSPLPAWEHGRFTACKKASAKIHLWVGKRMDQHFSVPSLPQQASTPSAGVNEPRPRNATGDFWSCSAIDTIYVSKLAVCSFFTLTSNLPAFRFLGGPTRRSWLIFTLLGARLTQRQFEQLSEKDVIAQR